MSAAPPSLNLGVIGNCAFSALVDQCGSIVGCCLPRFDGDPVFNALPDPSDNGSRWSIADLFDGRHHQRRRALVGALDSVI